MGIIMTAEERQEKFDAYAKRADPVTLALAFVFLVVWSTRVIGYDLDSALRAWLLVVQGWIWLAFLVDIIIRLTLAGERMKWLLHHPLDVIALLLPAARPLKILAVFTEGALLGGTSRVFNTTRAVIISALLLLWIGAVAVLSFERGRPGANIETFPDALWWSLVTVTTVGYGDFSPVTLEGRIVAAVLMLVGISLIGIVTATVAAWFVSLTSDEDEKTEAERHEELRAHIHEIEAKLDRLVQDSDARRSEDGPG